MQSPLQGKRNRADQDENVQKNEWLPGTFMQMK